MAEKAQHPDVVSHHLAGTGQIILKGDGRVKQAVHGKAAGLKVDSQPSGQQHIRLTRLDG